ncbi:DoxX family protein [Pedobacter sp. Leaf194]|uniref:DoxX family protein n=1 Tax=Pedobacter sp. Leaf194 TaxID=1736297 RepID=UPI00070340FA|nr:DoxX family protein [Pedobacter sp. Leaf194]KQS41879.1 DoxX family protein [Pedobacter sp. Leaf194]RZL61848.1 MAG: DoxX family protein [Pedobacter sp.]
MHQTDNRTFTFKLFLWIYALLYVLAGLNHFISTDVYYAIMPEWLPAHSLLIYLSGIIEIGLGVLLLFSGVRKLAAILLIVMLISFLPVHMYMIQKAPFMLGKILVTPIIAWARLPLQALLIYWAFYYYNK